MKKKKVFKETSFGKFVSKIIRVVPNIAGDVLEIATSGAPLKTAIVKIEELLKSDTAAVKESQELLVELESSKRQWEKEMYELDIKAFSQEVNDRKRATEQYIETNHEIADKLALSIMNKNLIFITALIFCQIIITVLTVFFLLKMVNELQTAVTIGTSLGSVIGTAVGTVVGSLLQERNSVVGFHFGASVERTQS
ncbi:hypothetical protein L3073_17590 [Ancylomarina sp. DW003]|nr:hypothetical protein [Ancylomarina sp. DW003]MDE5424032.1 hypothetical protein [Ancylomarina sp. DW003]